MRILLYPLAALALLLNGAIFGFFYAWVCSTMWGLDMTDSRIAITAMQAMNASVRNAVFAPAFFGTPLVLLCTAFLARWTRHRAAFRAFLCAAVVYLLGGMALTVAVNVPMNDALAGIRLPLAADKARIVWSHYSASWQEWNLVRTCASGLALMFTGYGIFRLGSDRAWPIADFDSTRNRERLHDDRP